MRYKFKFLLNEKDLFWSSIYYSYYSFRGFFGILFSLFFIVFLFATIILGYFSSFDTLYKIVIIFSSLLFTVIQPLLILIKVFNKIRLKPYTEVEFCFFENEFTILNNGNKNSFPYSLIFRVKKYKKMIVVFYDLINGQIFPNRIFNNNKIEFYNFLLEKIKK